MSQGWARVGDVRRQFADTVEGMDPTASTWSGHWTAADLAGHMLTFVELSAPKFMWQMLKAGFNYDKAADRIAQNFAANDSLSGLAQRLRDGAEKPNFSKSFPPEMNLSDALIHLADLTRPSGIDASPDTDAVVAALTFATTHKHGKNVVKADLLDGLTFRATDAEWSHGSGPEVNGAALDLLLAMAGRPVFDQLSGDGAQTFASRY